MSTLKAWEASQARLNTQKYSTSLMTVVELSSRKYGKESESESHSVVSNSLQPHGLYSPWNSPGQNTGVGSLSLLQGIFPTQESNSGLLHCRRILYQMSHQGSPGSVGIFMKSSVHHSLATSDKQNDLLALQPVGEGNGTPLQYSCLENPMGGGAW